MNKNRRIFLIVLDSYGIGEAPDAIDFDDVGCNTLRSIISSKEYHTPLMKKMGLFNIDGVDYAEGVERTLGAYGRLTEQSKGKDTTIGHWEIAGIISKNPLPTYPKGFPQDLLKKFSERTGRDVLCNKPYSGTDVIRDYGKEHVETGKLIVYTSADSVFQIAAHEEVVPVETLYEYCEIARELLQGEHGVGRVIARPFVGTYPDYQRTPRRHDYSLVPPADTMMDALLEAGYDTYGVGKIYDIFAGKGIAHTTRIKDNVDGMEKTMQLQKEDFAGLCFVNLVDFDMVYGHRNDIDGYAKAATVFDEQLQEFIKNMREEDILMITADHGCDPGFKGTDHSREYVPLMIYGNDIMENVNLGTRGSFADIAATIQDIFGLPVKTAGSSFKELILKDKKKEGEAERLVEIAKEYRERAYAPYSGFAVGAALLGKSGKVYGGCNVENAALSPGNCAERTAVFKAVSEGESEFQAIAIAGGKKGGKITTICAPCGVCRQVLAEFCNPKTFRVYLTDGETISSYTLEELLPLHFGPDNL